MNKKMILTGILTGIMTLFLIACGSNNAWEKEEKTIEMSDRIITENVEVEWELDNNPASYNK
ncbi:hypothetical protein [Peribacillus asahii]|uniref:hypothetical protein n=1 Tax=Peribacillus asahii TaxID=228899 RepID=UPI002079C6F9|nr:hypothetical protein [Peribacillus asahii]USK83430.1 hypothetical protein LIT35_13210 [Peribacillus asahii]